MDVKNENPNGCNVATNNIHPMILFFLNVPKIELNEGLQSLF